MRERAASNAEYVQFHPTGFYYRSQVRFLITKAVRSAGGRLFMQDYGPKWKDLAPRDVVARAIHQHMLATGSGCVYLDLKSYREHSWRLIPFVY